MTNLEIFKKTILSEGNALLDYGKRINDIELDSIINFILGLKGKLILMGVGKSGLIAQKIVATLSSTGTPSMFIHPTEAMHGDLGMIGKEDCVFAISYSGESEEMVAILPHIKDLGIKIITMSNNKHSRMSSLGDFFIPIHIDKEACPIQTAPMTSTTLTLAIGDAIAACLMSARGFNKQDFARFHPGGALGRNLFVKVADMMQKDNLPIISSKDNLKEAISTMTSGMLGSVFIIDSDRLVGILSDGDLRRFMQSNHFSLDLIAFDYASKNPKTIRGSNLAIEALKTMKDLKIQILPVLSDDGKLEGAIHLYTLLQAGFKY